MKVKAIAKMMSAASDGKFIVEYENERHTFTINAVRELSEMDAPILNHTAGMLKIVDGNIIVTAYDR